MSFLSMLMLGGGIVVAVVVICVIAESTRERKVQAAAEDLAGRALRKFPRYGGALAVMGDSLVLFMDTASQTALVTSDQGVAREIPFDQFISIQILEDGHSVAETRRKGVLGRAAVGGVLAGGAGAVVGALSARSVTTQREIVINISVVVKTTDPGFAVLSWCTFAPQIGVNHMTPIEVALQRERAKAFFDQFAPIFTGDPVADPPAVAI